MIWFAVGEQSMADALKNYEQHRSLYAEFSPINHLSADDPPLLMSYPADMTLPSKSAGHGIHHGMFGVRMKEKADSLGLECHLLIPGTAASDRYSTPEAFLMEKLLAP